MLRRFLNYAGLQKRVITILGAGASTPHIPGTAKVTTFLRGWHKYRVPTVPNQGWQDLMNDIDGQIHLGSLAYFDALYGHLLPLYQNSDKFLHFERLIHAALQIDHFSSHLQGSNEYLKAPLGALLEFKQSRAVYDNHTHSFICEQACIAILDYLTGFINAMSDEDKKKHSLNQFLNRFSCPLRPVSIFSLNYDTLPLYSELMFETGFHSRQGTTEAEFNPTLLLDNLSSNLFCQIHGSCLFGYPMEGAPEELMVRYSSLDEATKSRAAVATDSPHNADGSSSPGRLMITGLRKADAMLREPFATYYQMLQRELFRCHRWLIAGYGGGDFHMNQVIRRATRYWLSKGVKPRVVWVNYAPNQFFENGEAAWDIGNPIMEYCSESLAAVFPDAFLHSLGSPRQNGGYKWVKRDNIQYPRFDNLHVLLSFRGTGDTFANHSEEIFKFLQSA